MNIICSSTITFNSSSTVLGAVCLVGRCRFLEFFFLFFFALAFSLPCEPLPWFRGRLCRSDSAGVYLGVYSLIGRPPLLGGEDEDDEEEEEEEEDEETGEVRHPPRHLWDLLAQQGPLSFRGWPRRLSPSINLCTFGY